MKLCSPPDFDNHTEGELLAQSGLKYLEQSQIKKRKKVKYFWSPLHLHWHCSETWWQIQLGGNNMEGENKNIYFPLKADSLLIYYIIISYHYLEASMTSFSVNPVNCYNRFIKELVNVLDLLHFFRHWQFNACRQTTDV